MNISKYPIEINLDTCVESCNTLDDLFNRACVPNKTRFKLECF